jgi:hypothetical protein
MNAIRRLVIDKLAQFRLEWSKARQHMLSEKQQNMEYWRNRDARHEGAGRAS